MKLKYKLGDAAEVFISNIDKKSKPGEQDVTLCNFTDVYKNWAIHKRMSSNLMESTAKQADIEKFGLKKGYCVITKDSETRDDIGVSAYVADNMPGTVLGYHCAIIKPEETKISGNFLNVLLHAPYAQKYFEQQASGSGQRYTLTLDAIKNFPLPEVPLERQKIIGQFFSDLDRKIEEAFYEIRLLENTAKKLYGYWFLQFDFPDHEGKPYHQSGGKMVWNKELKQEIPAGWITSELGDLGTFSNGINYNKDETGSKNYRIVYVRDISNNSFIIDSSSLEHLYLEPERGDPYLIPNDSILIARTGIPGAIRIIENADDILYCGFITLFNPENKSLRNYLALTLKLYEGTNATKTGGSIIKTVSQDTLKRLLLMIPEKSIINQFNKVVQPIFEQIIQLQSEINQLTSLRDFLLPLLISGQVTIKDDTE